VLRSQCCQTPVRPEPSVPLELCGGAGVCPAPLRTYVRVAGTCGLTGTLAGRVTGVK